MATLKKPATKRDTRYDAATAKVGDELRNGPKVRIKIPIDKQNTTDLTVPVSVNGHVYQIKRGEYVEVPAVVAEILEGAGYI